MNRYNENDNRGAIARIVDFVLGAWLIVSAFAWPHGAEQQANTWILGVLAAAFAIIALVAVPRVRFFNALVAIWLVISAFAIPTVSVATQWNNVLVGIVLFVLSLVPSSVPMRYGPSHAV